MALSATAISAVIFFRIEFGDYMNKDFLHLSDWNSDEIWNLLNLAKELKTRFRAKETYRPFENLSMAMIFSKPSARTRVSFETGFTWMGGHALYLGPDDIGIGKREAVKDIARVLSRYNDMIMARLFSHEHMLELAEFSSVPVVNGLTDFNHPCQILADILTIWEHRTTLDDLSVTYIGDGNNIVHSWLQLAQRLPVKFTCICPAGYEPDDEQVRNAMDKGLSEIIVSDDLDTHIKGSDVVYTDVWASMGQKEEAEVREKIFRQYQVNQALMAKTGRRTLLLHCLPAERGREITDEALEADYSVVFDEAENRLHAQNAVMVTLLKKLI